MVYNKLKELFESMPGAWQKTNGENSGFGTDSWYEYVPHGENKSVAEIHINMDPDRHSVDVNLHIFDPWMVTMLVENDNPPENNPPVMH